jgi:LAO/AO transport system kinase
LTSDLADEVARGDRRALARAITLVESTRADRRPEIADLLDRLLPHTRDAIRLGISGAPGVGKSTFIERLGLHIIDQGLQVAVLTVDPSSARSGGSILGDKTRMNELARRPEAFIRPSPSGGALGGVAPRTREAMLVCEAAGFDVVLVETVGVGQSETEVDDMVDLFLLLVGPGAGDDLQGMKRGITELADMVIVTKADGELLADATRAAADYRHALEFLRMKHAGLRTEVLLWSAVANHGADEIWNTTLAHRRHLVDSGLLASRRAEQAVAWMWSELHAAVVKTLHDDPGIASMLRELEGRVAAGTTSATTAAATLLAAMGR